MDEDIVATLKILIIGESGVGKSSLLLRFTDDLFDPQQSATIGNFNIIAKKLNFALEFSSKLMFNFERCRFQSQITVC